MPGIGVITNPHSRQNRRNPQRVRRLAFLVGASDAFELTHSVDDIEAAARRFLDRQIDILALNGGDGTNHVTLTAFLRVWGDHPLPRIAILRGGTMNTVANSFGIEGDPGSILLRLTEKYSSGEPFQIDRRPLVAVDADQQTRYGFIVGNGVVSNFLEEYYRYGDVTPIHAARTLARAVGSAIVGGPLIRRITRTFHAELRADGEHWFTGQLSSVLASSTEQVGLGFRPFHRCTERPGAFHAIAISGSGFDIVRALPDIHRGQHIRAPGFSDRVLSRLDIRTDDDTAITIDGDVYPVRGNVTFRTGPEVDVIVA